MKRLISLVFILVAAACTKSSGTPVTPVVTTTNVSFLGGAITATVASKCAARETGLKNVTSLGVNSGMLFVFAENHDSVDVAFYMKDTPTPLSIAFIDSNNMVINTDDMAPETLTQHFSKRPFRYAIEVNLGWLTAHGVAPGSAVTFALPAGTITDPVPCVP